MAIAAIPDEINRHIEAALALSKRDVLLKVLDEADRCFQLDQVTGAALLAGVALQEVSLLPYKDGFELHSKFLDVWREIRNRAAHSSPVVAEPDKQSVGEMLKGVRALVEQTQKPQERWNSSPVQRYRLSETRGKYAFVRTSVDEFLKRKHDELTLEENE